MTLMTFVYLIAGLVLLVAGYRSRNRNVMLSAAIILFLSASVDSLVGGFLEGYQKSQAAHQVTGQL